VVKGGALRDCAYTILFEKSDWSALSLFGDAWYNLVAVVMSVYFNLSYRAKY